MGVTACMQMYVLLFFGLLAQTVYTEISKESEDSNPTKTLIAEENLQNQEELRDIEEIPSIARGNKTEILHLIHSEFTIIVPKGGSECMFVETLSDGQIFKYYYYHQFYKFCGQC